MANDIGLSVVEGVANGLAPFTEPSKRNIGLLMERVRGVENVPFRITSLADDAARFGGLNANMYGPTVVRNLFKNAKGKPLQMYGIRIVGTGSAAATTGAVTVIGVSHTLVAGQQGVADKGTWGNSITAKFYSYDYNVKNKYSIDIFYQGVFVETFDASTMALLQATINSNSMYITATFSAEYAIPLWVAGTGTITTTLGSTTVTGVGTAFSTTTTPIGSLLRDSAGNILGVIASITSTTVLDLEKPSTMVVTADTFEYFKRFTNSFVFAGGLYVAPIESNFYYGTVPTKFGLALFDGVDIQLLGVTENNTLTMAQEMKDYCATITKNKVLAVVVPPLNATEAVIASYASALQGASVSQIALYNVWVKTSDGTSTGSYIVPGLGCVLGAAYVRVPALQNDFVHIPPAGIDSAFTDIIEVYPKTLDQATINLYTRSYTTNSVIFTKGLGFYVLTSRTMSTGPLYQSVHIYLLTSFYLRVLEQNMGFVIQRPNTPQLKRDIISVLHSFFRNQYDIGALEQSVPFTTACELICDKTNNPNSQPRTELNATVNYIPTETTEAFKIALNRNDGVLIVSAEE